MSETIHTTDRESVGLAPTINSVAREGNREHAIQARALAILVGGIFRKVRAIRGTTSKAWRTKISAQVTLPGRPCLQVVA